MSGTAPIMTQHHIPEHLQQHHWIFTVAGHLAHDCWSSAFLHLYSSNTAASSSSTVCHLLANGRILPSNYDALK